MGFISPKQIYDDRKLWLSVPHELHESVFKLMKRLYDDFDLDGIHCLECEGKKPFRVIDKTDLKEKFCTGYVEQDGKVELLRLKEI